MALSNIFREPRREITETLLGVVPFAGFFWLDYKVTEHFMALDAYPDHNFIAALVLTALCLGIAGVLGTVLVLAIHVTGEAIADSLADRGLDPRPTRSTR